MGAHPARSDLMVSLGFTAVALVEIVLTPPLGMSVPQRVGEFTGVVLIAGCFAFRRLHPALSAVLALLLVSGVSLASTHSNRLWEIAALMLACYSGARHSTRTGSWVVLATAVAYTWLASTFEESADVWMYVGNFLFFLGLMVAIPWTAGRALRRRQALSRYDAERAVEDERARIARELHDVVGHALGMIVVQAEGERAQLAPDAPESTRETLEVIAGGARDALDDVRRLLVVLRAQNDLAPQPGLHDVPKLLEGLSSAGLPVELEVVRRLPPAARRDRPLGVPRRPGGAYERAASLPRRAGPRLAELRPRRNRDRGHRRRPRLAERGVARTRAARDAGASGALRWQQSMPAHGPKAASSVHVHLPTRGGAADELGRTRV